VSRRTPERYLPTLPRTKDGTARPAHLGQAGSTDAIRPPAAPTSDSAPATTPYDTALIVCMLTLSVPPLPLVKIGMLGHRIATLVALSS
jgi:hypothetical protein